MNINPGELRQRIKFISNGSTTDSDGYTVPNRTTEYECWAKFTRTSGSEIMQSSADFTDVKVRFLIRYTALIDRKMLIEYAGEDYEIEYINDYEDKHEYSEIWARRVTMEAV